MARHQPEYASIAGATLSYDAAGNLTNDGAGMTYTYDMENRLVATGGAASSSMVYDTLGRLSRYTATGTTTQFLYDGDALVAEYVGSTLTRRYVHGDQVDEPLVQYNSASVGSGFRRYLHADHLGSIIAHSDSSGGVPLRKSYDAYGISATTGDPVVDGKFGFTGQTWLKEIGLNYYKARMYSPKLGRFLQTDPIFYRDDMNLHAYVGNDPVNGTDPTGLYICTGSDANCKAVEAGLTRAREIHAKMKPGADKTNLGKVIALYGKAGEKNGVNVSFTSAVDVGDEVMNSDGSISIRFHSQFSTFGKNWEDANIQDVQAGIVANEGLHGVDDRALGSPKTYAAELEKERRGYDLQSRMHQLQGTRAVPGVWQPVWLNKASSDYSPYPELRRREWVFKYASGSAYDWCNATAAPGCP